MTLALAIAMLLCFYAIIVWAGHRLFLVRERARRTPAPLAAVNLSRPGQSAQFAPANPPSRRGQARRPR
jgi:hypothetical protein